MTVPHWWPYHLDDCTFLMLAIVSWRDQRPFVLKYQIYFPCLISSLEYSICYWDVQSPEHSTFYSVNYLIKTLIYTLCFPLWGHFIWRTQYTEALVNIAIADSLLSVNMKGSFQCKDAVLQVKKVVMRWLKDHLSTTVEFIMLSRWHLYIERTPDHWWVMIWWGYHLTL